MKDPVIMIVPMEELKDHIWELADVREELTKLRCRPDLINAVSRILHRLNDAVKEVEEGGLDER